MMEELELDHERAKDQEEEKEQEEEVVVVEIPKPSKKPTDKGKEKKKNEVQFKLTAFFKKKQNKFFGNFRQIFVFSKIFPDFAENFQLVAFQIVAFDGTESARFFMKMHSLREKFVEKSESALFL